LKNLKKNLSNFNIVKFLDGTLNLVFIRTNIHNEHKRVCILKNVLKLISGQKGD